MLRILIFGLGLAAGNLLGGRLADRRLMPALIGTLLALALVLLGLTAAVHDRMAAVLFVGLFGAAAFATVAPLQLRVLQQAGDAGQNLASSLNIAAFNLGNALGAWAGGMAIDHAVGLEGVPLVAAAITAAGLGVAVLSARLSRRSDAAPIAAPL